MQSTGPTISIVMPENTHLWGSITVPTDGLQLNKTGLDQQIKYVVFVSREEAVESELVKLETSCRYSDTSRNSECSLVIIFFDGILFVSKSEEKVGVSQTHMLQKSR